MKADEKTKEAVFETVKSLLEAYESHDLDKVMALYAKDPDVTAIGTNLDQFLTGGEAIREAYADDFEAFSSLTLKVTDYIVSAEGSVAWLSAECLAGFEIDGDDIKTQSRLTAVLVLRQGQWRIIQLHLSFPSDETGMENPQKRL